MVFIKKCAWKVRGKEDNDKMRGNYQKERHKSQNREKSE